MVFQHAIAELAHRFAPRGVTANGGEMMRLSFFDGHNWADRLPTIVAVVAMASLLFVVASTSPLRTQGVQLVKVDTAVVAKGYRASKLIGSTEVNDRDEKIGRRDEFKYRA
jgi:hypothetical protein